MANNNVKFYFGSSEKFNALTEKNPLALYFLEDVQQLWKGDKLFATGANATSMAAGLMSAEDKMKLDDLVAGGGISNLVPIDGTLVIADTDNGAKSIGVAVSAEAGNIIVKKSDGLYVESFGTIDVPSYSIEKQSVAEDGYSATYKLVETVGNETSYVGDAINIPKDMVLQSATLEVVVENNVPYDGAVIGDPYIKMTFNDAANSSIYVPVKGLIDTYTAGNGVEIVDNNISVKIASESNGLVAVDGALSIALATKNSAGALSAIDKAFIDAIPTTYATIERVKDTAVQVKYDISATPEGTLVNYGEKEIRVMCPANAKFVKQNVGNGGNANMYYMTFTSYAPDGAVTFKEGDRGVFVDEILNFETTAGTGVDKYGRKYKNHWFALASYDASTDKWTYFGKNSTTDKYIGWDYIVEWYDENGVAISSDSIRINLSNEDCHSVIKPYYMAGYTTDSELDEVKEAIANIAEAYSWSEM